jgi:hypothetical protein
METIINSILKELEKAELKYPEWPKDIIHQASIVNEESGELIRACLNIHYHNEDINEAKQEAIQTAAMAIRFLKNIE